jgi:hypothetical protein
VKILLFGATGMVGQGVLRECLLDREVEAFKAVMFRPAGIVPLHGITSKTRLYRVAYALTRPLWSSLLGAFPQYMTTTEQVGRAMLRVAKDGSPKPILETRDINALRVMGSTRIAMRQF